MLSGGTFSAAADPGENAPRELKVLTYNVWHGLRRGKVLRLEGEDRDRSLRRMELQIAEIRELAPDLVLLQEVNWNPGRSREYAQALGYDEVHKVTDCGIKLPPIKIPVNLKSGLTILARPDLGLRRVDVRRLSGPGMCGDVLGFQLAESRYALLAEITIGTEKVLVANTHLHASARVLDDFEPEVDRLVAERALTERQAATIFRRLRNSRTRRLAEIRKLLRTIERRRERDGYAHVILGGDLNAEPGAPPLDAIAKARLHEAATASSSRWPTFDPLANAENHAIGERQRSALLVADVPELKKLIDAGNRAPRRIDHVFASRRLTAVSTIRVLDEPVDGLIPSDHFGILATFQLP